MIKELRVIAAASVVADPRAKTIAMPTLRLGWALHGRASALDESAIGLNDGVRYSPVSTVPALPRFCGGDANMIPGAPTPLG